MPFLSGSKREVVAGRAGLIGLCAGLAACVGPWTPAPAPLVVERLAPMPAGGECLVVLLPGRGDRAGVFRREGFAPAVAAAGIRAEVVAADLHLGYYVRRTADVRLREDVVAPARARGVRQVWLVGVSMGGLGTLMYDRYHPGEVDGLVLLAPFLGDRPVIEEVAAAGGLARWTPPATLAADDWQRDIWRWLRRWVEPRGTPLLVLGWGESDALARSNRLLAEVLPPERVFVRAGGHDWRVWRELWTAMLASGQVAPGCR
ncbi:MAG TPA: alpha/beta fold hydrolase [Thermoanaerobaculaceae bacterium]|nr:alpha/beta fold hydrolase [Thermoanaerobaculaceae bacterium]HRS15072.1 alpha/beta fold hydrolase [Thermoanaerobaculaceae bacterium]